MKTIGGSSNDPPGESGRDRAAPAESEGAPMIGWYEPRQLLQTGVGVVVSKLFGDNADYRVIEALQAPATTPCDRSNQDEL